MDGYGGEKRVDKIVMDTTQQRISKQTLLTCTMTTTTTANRFANWLTASFILLKNSMKRMINKYNCFP